MPRKPRLTVPGAVHHIMARGIDGRALFEDDQDRQTFLFRLEQMLARGGYRCYAWVLMNNHYHLLPRISHVPLGGLMGWLNSKYARYHGKRHDRRGYLFQDRFKSIVTQDQGYIERLIRYIHLNPVRAGICRSLDELRRYRWCGHGALMGDFECSFLSVNEVLRRFGSTPLKARAAYERFLAEGLESGADEKLFTTLRAANEERSDRLEPGRWVIGDHEFVKNALAADRDRRLRTPAYLTSHWSLERLASAVEKALGLAPREMSKRGRGNNRSYARKVFCFYAVRRLEYSGRQAAAFLGVATAAVSQSLDQGERLVDERELHILD